MASIHWRWYTVARISSTQGEGVVVGVSYLGAEALPSRAIAQRQNRSATRARPRRKPKVNNLEFHAVKDWKSHESMTFIQEDQQWTLHKFGDIIEYTKRSKGEEQGERLEDATTLTVARSALEKGEFTTPRKRNNPQRHHDGKGINTGTDRLHPKERSLGYKTIGESDRRHYSSKTNPGHIRRQLVSP
ncbi:hypothetical protein BDZ91DRAFT_768452 [Kalaharituber pfeilii]|nr:hypothetical protein BDZ91DRAFT_768452 [Kalaharituber pfeilii]